MTTYVLCIIKLLYCHDSRLKSCVSKYVQCDSFARRIRHVWDIFRSIRLRNRLPMRNGLKKREIGAGTGEREEEGASQEREESRKGTMHSNDLFKSETADN